MRLGTLPVITITSLTLSSVKCLLFGEDSGLYDAYDDMLYGKASSFLVSSREDTKKPKKGQGITLEVKDDRKDKESSRSEDNSSTVNTQSASRRPETKYNTVDSSSQKQAPLPSSTAAPPPSQTMQQAPKAQAPHKKTTNSQPQKKPEDKRKRDIEIEWSSSDEEEKEKVKKPKSTTSSATSQGPNSTVCSTVGCNTQNMITPPASTARAAYLRPAIQNVVRQIVSPAYVVPNTLTTFQMPQERIGIPAQQKTMIDCQNSAGVINSSFSCQTQLNVSAVQVPQPSTVLKPVPAYPAVPSSKKTACSSPNCLLHSCTCKQDGINPSFFPPSSNCQSPLMKRLNVSERVLSQFMCSSPNNKDLLQKLTTSFRPQCGPGSIVNVSQLPSVDTLLQDMENRIDLFSSVSSFVQEGLDNLLFMTEDVNGLIKKYYHFIAARNKFLVDLGNKFRKAVSNDQQIKLQKRFLDEKLQIEGAMRVCKSLQSWKENLTKGLERMI